MKTAVCALIVDKDGLILAVTRKDDPNDWGLPGGKLDEDETMRQGLTRETLEETGYIVELINTLDYFEAVENGMLVRTYRAKILSKTYNSLDPSETGLIAFKTKEEILKGSFKEYNINCFQHFNL